MVNRKRGRPEGLSLNGAKLRLVIEANFSSRRHFAEEIGIPHQTIGLWLTRGTIKKDFAYKVKDYLELSVEECKAIFPWMTVHPLRIAVLKSEIYGGGITTLAQFLRYPTKKETEEEYLSISEHLAILKENNAN